jgi:hypothetical protein
VKPTNASRLSHVNNQANTSLRPGRFYTKYDMRFNMKTIAFHKIDTFV